MIESLNLRALGKAYFLAKGFYLVPAAAVALVAARYALSRPEILRRLGEARARLARRLLAVGLAVTATVASLAYVSFFDFVYGGFLNPYEFFHYYLGSKYAAEVGYFDMYDAAVVADREDGPILPADDGWVCDLRTYGYKPIREVLADGARVKARFSEARWSEWVRDVTYFKRRLGAPRFADAVRDKGYNATPAWTAFVGGALSRHVPTTAPSGMLALALLDVVLLAAVVVAIGRVYGTVPALLTVTFIGSSYLMAHVHMKGAFLRTDFAVALALAMILLHRGRSGLAGALVGYAAVARVFPVIFLFGPAVKLLEALVPVARAAFEALRPRRGRLLLVGLGTAATAAALLEIAWRTAGDGIRAVAQEHLGSWGILRAALWLPLSAALLALALAVWGTSRRRLDPSHARFFGGFALAVVGLVGGSLVRADGPSAWEEFARKIALHRSTYNHWNIGIHSIVIAEFDPPVPRREALALRPEGARNWRGNVFFRPAAVHEREGLLRVLQLAAVVLAFAAARKVPDSRAFALGFVPAFFLTAPTYYYFIILLLPFLYFASDLDRLRGTLGTGYLFLFGGSGFAFYFTWNQYFATTYWNSVLAAGLAGGMLVDALLASKGPNPFVRNRDRGVKRVSTARGR